MDGHDILNAPTGLPPESRIATPTQLTPNVSSSLSSSFSTTEESDFDWQEIFKDAGHMHITGITPALGEKLPAVCIDACRNAKKADVTISCDLNYRAKLWSCEQAKAVMEQVLQYVDLLIANEEDSEKILDIKASGTDVKNGVISRDGYVEVAEKIAMKYGVRNVAITLRESITASDNIWSAMLYRGGHAVFSRKYPVHIVDRVGGGDSFSAALIYAYINGYESQRAIEYAAAASALKHSIESDFNLVTVSEIESLVCGNTTGRVQR